MAASPSTPAFGPEEARRILDHLQHPAVFPDMSRDWPVLRWTAERLARRLPDKLIPFRLGNRRWRNGPLFETQCSYAEATLAQFLCWTRGGAGADMGRLSKYPRSQFWAYADYKYIATLLADQPSMFQDVRWSHFGLEGRDGRHSTLWVGSEGANTPCHLDSYGWNLVLQVEGRKRWLLFPPEDTDKLYPTRIPYEESSVFSQVDVLRPDLRRFPAFRGAAVHTVTLQPGQVLFVPRHWWHYVESVDPVTVSVNSWMELESDDVARVGEALTKTIVCALKSARSDDNTDDWLNPTEEGASPHSDNMQLVSLAVAACAARRGRRPGRGVKRDSDGHVRKRRGSAAAFRVPYGPHLLPVPRREEQEQEESRAEEEQEEPAGSRGSAEELSSGRTTVSTNDLLDCLLHPEVISRVTQLLLERHAPTHRPPDPTDPPY
ncbi:HSPB1-associated protein 1 homolog [Salarias fasciatus]|uniref:JmjC domain-containing protein n=1 Tax=Salarias fasciatus TaxID=181472 RepID=A0A672IL24_SALFA|nr:HSPB1-associated protein 1 [Salarias fasciatus]